VKTFALDSPDQIIDELTYVNYRANRGYSPEITPERWEKVYGPKVYRMEQRFQMEVRS
jgi:hypothetical protein